MSRINASIGGLLALAAFVTAGCQSSVTSGKDEGGAELSLEQGSETYLTGVVGDGVTCQTPDVWKLESYEVCLAQGLTLVELTFAMDCADGTSTTAEYACGEIPPPPPQDPGSCAIELLGDGTTCHSPEEWKLIIAGSGANDGSAGVCEAQGLYLIDVAFTMDCANGGSTSVKVACCPTANTPPEPDPNAPVCTSGALGNGTVCSTAAEWTAQAEEICAQKGLTDLQMGFAEDCPDGGSSYAKFYCCEP